MIAEIVSVGTELLMGQVVNTDAQYMASRLAPLGYQVYYHVTVGDNVKRLTEVVRIAIERSNVVIFSGGLGPTEDDLTKETVAAALGLTCEPIEEEVERLKAYFREKLHREMTPNNLKQASFPREATILPNPNGTAPGCIMCAGGKTAVLLPGPPRELVPMFSDYVEPYLAGRSNTRLYSREIRIFGMGESEVTFKLRDIIDNQTNPTVAPYAKTGEVTLRITAQCSGEPEGIRLVEPFISEIRARLGDVVYSDQGEDLPHLNARLLSDKGLTLSVAESCTGGMLASALVDVPGSSAFFTEGCVTYSNAAKVRRLGVKEETLSAVGPVSQGCAREMAEGMRKTSRTDYALATTGFAGPEGGTPDQPVGTVFIALAGPEGTTVKRLALHGDRERIRSVAVLHVLDLLRRALI
jgi:nicotinamide-nucleotide amidase